MALLAVQAIKFTLNTAGNLDPTRTLVLRGQFVAQVNKRFRDLKGAINQLLTKDNFLDPVRPTEYQPGIIPIALAAKYEYMRSDVKVEQFMGWLKDQERQGILEIIQRPGGLRRGQSQAWSDTYIRSSYSKGIAQGRADLRKLGADIPSFEQIPGGISSVFNQPFHADRVALCYTRCFNGMKGVTEAMNGYLSRELALGMAGGQSPYAIAKRINERVDKIGIVRARMIARTEIIQSHNEAALNEYERAEIEIGETVKVEWVATMDNRVRPHHAERDGKIYERSVAREMLGEPNCRCSLAPYVESLDKKTPKAPVKKAVGKLGKSPMSIIGDLANCIIPTVNMILNRPVVCSDYTRDAKGNWFLAGKVIGKDVIEKLNKMRIPSAWRDVVIAINPMDKIQAIGRDSAGRWQYRYSAAHIVRAAQRKFDKIKSFARDLPLIRIQMKYGIAAGDSRAFLLSLEDKTAIRAGSTADLKAKKKAYGLTTLKSRHVKVEGNKIIFDFTAKGGLPAYYEIEDSVLAKWLRERKTMVGVNENLFSDIPASKMNKYIQEISGKKYTLKDYRTYHGTRIAREELEQYAGRELTKKEKKDIVKKVSTKVSEFLHNTSAMAKGSYINPMVWNIIGGLP